MEEERGVGKELGGDGQEGLHCRQGEGGEVGEVGRREGGEGECR